MKKIIIFSGTTEGRTLSTLLTQRRVPHVVCVASAYGGEMMEDSTFAELHIGRMDAVEMKQFLSARISGGEGMVVDATHPYATEVTANIKQAAETLGVSYLRVVRGASDAAPGDMAVYSDIRACAEAMDQTTGNILLTTGSKELRAYCAVVSEETRKRTYVRVLPTMSSLEQCISEGIEGDYTTDFLCKKTDGTYMVRECVYRSRIIKPMHYKLLEQSRNYWLHRGVMDWGCVINEKK